MVTIKDIAKYVNLDVSTISRALNESSKVKESTKKHIKRVAKQLGYQKNDIARGLVTKKTNTIGLLISDISNPFFAELAKGVEYEANKNSYSVILCNSNWDPKKERDSIDVLKRKRVDGLLIHASMGLIGIYKKEYKDDKIPEVFLGNFFDHKDYDEFYYVSIDNIKAAHETTSYLISLGHRKIAHITGNITKDNKGYNILIDRLNGYKLALEEAGIKYNNDLILETSPGISSSCNITKEFIKEHKYVTAIFASCDIMALGVYKAIFDLGLKIPLDISVAGFDDIEISSLLNPKLTTYEQPKFVMGSTATKILLDLINGNKPEKKGLILKSNGLIKRESCKFLEH